MKNMNNKFAVVYYNHESVFCVETVLIFTGNYKDCLKLFNKKDNGFYDIVPVCCLPDYLIHEYQYN